MIVWVETCSKHFLFVGEAFCTSCKLLFSSHILLFFPYFSLIFCMPYCFVLMRARIYSWEASTAQFMYFHAPLSTPCPLQSVCWVIKVELPTGIGWIKSGIIWSFYGFWGFKGFVFRKYYFWSLISGS